MVFDEYRKSQEVEGGRSAELTEILMKQLDTIPENPADRFASEVQRELSYREIAEVMQLLKRVEDMDSPSPA